ncbi:TPA_asm: hypothetical protein GFY42_15325, partial [Listeria monocytogenes]|nr:hypothetical protein [Listeria monocytogenes]
MKMLCTGTPSEESVESQSDYDTESDSGCNEAGPVHNGTPSAEEVIPEAEEVGPEVDSLCGITHYNSVHGWVGYGDSRSPLRLVKYNRHNVPMPMLSMLGMQDVGHTCFLSVFSALHMYSEA